MILFLLLIFFCSAIVCWLSINASTEALTNFSESFTRYTHSKLNTMFVFKDFRYVVYSYVGVIIVLPVVLLALKLSPVLVVVVVIFIVALPKWLLHWMALRRRSAINAALPDCLHQICGAMRAGSTFSSAISAMVEEQTGPISQEFSLLLREQRMGSRLEEALDNLGDRVQSEEMDLVISATLISQEVGGNLAEILARLAETIRRKMEMEGKVAALTSQGVLQGYVVTALPFLIMMALMGVESESMRPLFHSVLGWAFLLVIIVLQVLGGLSIRRIVSIDI